MKNTFSKLFNEHKGKVTDKWSLYINEWDRIFGKYKYLNISILEIGVQNGGSLEIWGKFFEKANNIIGCDINEKCSCLHYDDARINVVIGDANSDTCEKSLLELSTSFNIIIDDGSHIASDVIRSFARYFPHLEEGGLYVIEDLHASYWSNFKGGLNNQGSSLSFFKRLIDIVNFEHWRNDSTRMNYLQQFIVNLGLNVSEGELAKIHSIEFLDSLCIIRKLPQKANILGKRCVVGVEACVEPEMRKFDQSQIQDISVDIQDNEVIENSQYGFANEILLREIAQKDLKILDLNERITCLTKSIQELKYQVEKENVDLEKPTYNSQSATGKKRIPSKY